MKEEKQRLMRTLADAYQSGWAKWLFLILTVQTLLPTLINTMLLFTSKASLGNVLPAFVSFFCLLASGVLVIPAAMSATGEKKPRLSLYLTAFFPCAAAVLLSDEILLFALYRLSEGGGVWIALLAYLLAVLLMTAAYIRAVSVVLAKKPVLKSWRTIWALLLCAAMVYLSVYLLPSAAQALTAALFQGGTLWFSSVLGVFASVLAGWLLLPAILALIASRMAPAGQTAGEAVAPSENGTSPEGEQGPAESLGGVRPKRRFSTAKAASHAVELLSAAVLAAGLGLAVFPNLGKTDAVEEFIGDYVTKATSATISVGIGDYVFAVKAYDEMELELDAWALALGFELEELSYSSLSDMVRDHPDNDTVAYLYACTSGESTQLAGMEELYITGRYEGYDFLFSLLDEYKRAEENEELTNVQQLRRNRILTGLAANGVWSGTERLSPQTLMEDEDAAAAAVTACIDLCDELYNKGFYNAMAEIQDMVNPQSMDISSVVNYAGNHPDDIEAQKAAMDTILQESSAELAGRSSYLSVYERYDSLWNSEIAPGATEEEKLAHIKYMISAYQMSLDFEKIVEYALTALETYRDDPELMRSAVYALAESGEAEECLKLTSRALAKNAEDPYMLYYAAVAEMHQQDYDAAIDYGLKLSGLVKNSSVPEIADNYLYQYVSKMNTTRDAGYGGAVSEYVGFYNYLSDEQLAKIEADELLYQYIQAWRGTYTYNQGTREEAPVEEVLASLDRVLAIQPEIGQPYRMKADRLAAAVTKSEKALSDTEAYQEIVDLYIKATQYVPNDPYIWFNLYDIYRQMGDYVHAQQCAELALTFSSWSDYIGDGEGIGVHIHSDISASQSLLLDRFRELYNERNGIEEEETGSVGEGE